MADHGTVEYATAAGNDYPAHENTYETFIKFTFVGCVHVITVLLGLTVGGVLGHWFTALVIFIVGLLGLIPGLATGSKTPSYVSLVLCLLIFGFTALAH